MKIIVPLLKTQADAPGPAAHSRPRGVGVCSSGFSLSVRPRFTRSRGTHMSLACRVEATCHVGVQRRRERRRVTCYRHEVSDRTEQKGTKRNTENLSLCCFVAWLFKNLGSSAVKTPMNLRQHQRNPRKHWLLTQLNRFIQIYTCYFCEKTVSAARFPRRPVRRKAGALRRRIHASQNQRHYSVLS